MYKTVLLVTALAFSGSALADPAAPPKPDDGSAQMVCKRLPRTGSLVARYRECKTKWEWARERELLQTLKVTDSCRDRANGGALCGQ